jgi:hypothetical protein
MGHVVKDHEGNAAIMREIGGFRTPLRLEGFLMDGAEAGRRQTEANYVSFRLEQISMDFTEISGSPPGGVHGPGTQLHIASAGWQTSRTRGPEIQGKGAELAQTLLDKLKGQEVFLLAF